MNKMIHHTDELRDALRFAGEETLGNHLSDDDCVRYVLSQLSQAEEEVFDAHVAVCVECASRLEYLFDKGRTWCDDSAQRRLDDFSDQILTRLATVLPQAKRDVEGTEFNEGLSVERAPLRLRTSSELDVLVLLNELNVIERDYDYVLPSGLHCDTYVNTGKICHSEHGLHQISLALQSLFVDVDFDTIVCSGWATGVIARRLAYERTRIHHRRVRVVITEGYSPLSFTEDIPPSSKVLILIDVAITGRLLDRLSSLVGQYGAIVAAMGCIARPADTPATFREDVRALVTIDMALNDPTRSHCPRCSELKKRVFNPISSQMTVKKVVPRSPSQFLEEFPEAVSFWEAVNEAQAYEHHHIEGDTHYLAFVNTAKLLAHPTIGPQVVGALLEKLSHSGYRPGVILTPDRARARLLAMKTARLIADRLGVSPPEVVCAQRYDGFWTIKQDVRRRLAQENVLVLDTAAGHGCVLDDLTLLATDTSARSVSAAVLLSRLTESCEEAFANRLSGGFVRLFHLPIRPIGIRTKDRSLCPICRERALILEAADEHQKDALVQLAERIEERRARHFTVTLCQEVSPSTATQLMLFEVPKAPLLVRCRRNIASGITLHALHTSMTDGMAPLSLPELRNSTIPASNRAAMLEYLPSGVLSWSESYLDQSLEDVLMGEGEQKVWLASAELLAREGRVNWVAYLESFLERSDALRLDAHDPFWNQLAYGAFRSCRSEEHVRDEVLGVMRHLLDDYREEIPAQGLQRVVEVLAEPV